jgi:hypothetical protein
VRTVAILVPLRHRRFRRVWTGQVISAVGDGMFGTARRGDGGGRLRLRVFGVPWTSGVQLLIALAVLIASTIVPLFQRSVRMFASAEADASASPGTAASAVPGCADQVQPG